MLKKSEARRMVEEFYTKVEARKKEEAFAFCDNDITEAIEAAAKQGKGRVKISIPTTLSVSLITNYLTDNGYAVSKMTNSYLLIEW